MYICIYVYIIKSHINIYICISVYKIKMLCKHMYLYLCIYNKNVLIKKEERERRLERGKMTTTTQPGIEPGTSRFPGDCSTS